MAVKIQIVILWVMKQSNLAGGYQRSEGDLVTIYKIDHFKTQTTTTHSIP